MAKSTTMTSVEMQVQDLDDNEIDGIITEMTEYDSDDDELAPFENIIEKELKLINADEIIKTEQIIRESNINGLFIADHNNSQQMMEEFLNSHFGYLWTMKKQYCSSIAKAILQNINEIKQYSLDEMINFFTSFEIEQCKQALRDGNWNEEKLFNAKKKEFNKHMAKYNIPMGISAKLYKALTASKKQQNNNKQTQNKSRGSRRVIFNESKDEKQYEQQEEEEEEEEKYNAKYITQQQQQQHVNQRIAAISDPNNNETYTTSLHAPASGSTVIEHSKTPEPPTNNTVYSFSDWKYDVQDNQFPTYISKAVCEDDTLELLMDRAVSKVLSIPELWRKDTFCHSLYNDATFKDAVETIYKIVHNEEEEYDFINEFIERECSREISKYQKEVDKNNNDESKINNKNSDEKKYDDVNRRNLEVQISRTEMDISSQCIESRKYKIKIDLEPFDEPYEWALFRRKSLRNVFQRTIKTSGYWKILTKNPDDDYDEEALEEIQKQDSFEIEEKEMISDGLEFFTMPLENSQIGQNDDSGPVQRDIGELNAILMFLQNMDEEYLSQQDKGNIEFIPSDLKKMKQPIIRIIFDNENEENKNENSDNNDNDDNHHEKKFVVEDGIDEETVKLYDRHSDKSKKGGGGGGDGEESIKWYDIYWWNTCKDSNKVHALALKNYLSKGKMEYYLRYVMGQNPKESKSRDISIKNSRSNTTKSIDPNSGDSNNSNIKKKESLEWIWFDNDTASYRRYDLGNNVLKQLEASFHSNCSNIFPKKLNCNFNYLLLKEMTSRLKKRGRNVGLGYVLRFAYSNSDRAKIVNMEQLSTFKNAPQFARNVQRMVNGRNSIFMYFSSNNSEYVDEWKNRYLLYTEAQQKYFWSHVLAVSAATHYITVEIKNQIITFNYSETTTTSQQRENIVFQELNNNVEIQKEQKSYLEYPGFLITPQQFTHNTQEIQEPDHVLKSTFQYLIKDSRAVILQKFNTQPAYDKREGDLPIQHCPHANNWIYRNGQQQFFCQECASLLQFAEFVRKFVLEFEHPEVTNFLWPWYRNTFHHNDFIKYHNYISRYNLSTLYAQSDILQMKANQSSILHFDGCFKKMKKGFEDCTHQIRTCSCCQYSPPDLNKQEVKFWGFFFFKYKSIRFCKFFFSFIIFITLS